MGKYTVCKRKMWDNRKDARHIRVRISACRAAFNPHLFVHRMYTSSSFVTYEKFFAHKIEDTQRLLQYIELGPVQS